MNRTITSSATIPPNAGEAAAKSISMAIRRIVPLSFPLLRSGIIIYASMNIYELFGLAIALAMDAFAVSLAAGATLARITPRHYFRLAWHFGLFQFMMPVIGWAAGRAVYERLSAFDHWIAFFLLTAIGVRMIAESRAAGRRRRGPDPTRGWTLVMLSVATSIDALAVGVSLAFLKVGIWQACTVIGLVAAAASVAGVKLGDVLGEWIGRRAELAGGAILVGIGLKILVEHL